MLEDADSTVLSLPFPKLAVEVVFRKLPQVSDQKIPGRPRGSWDPFERDKSFSL